MGHMGGGILMAGTGHRHIYWGSMSKQARINTAIELIKQDQMHLIPQFMKQHNTWVEILLTLAKEEEE